MLDEHVYDALYVRHGSNTANSRLSNNQGGDRGDAPHERANGDGGDRNSHPSAPAHSDVSSVFRLLLCRRLLHPQYHHLGGSLVMMHLYSTGVEGEGQRRFPSSRQEQPLSFRRYFSYFSVSPFPVIFASRLVFGVLCGL